MCTSFMFRGDDTLIAMNYDNHGKNLKLAPHRNDLFLVTINSYGKDRPLFGVRSDGVMVNQQVVDACEKGDFRLGYKVIHTSQLVGKILVKRVPKDGIPDYIKRHKVVNPPTMSIHSFVACADDQSCIIEPGRGVIWYPSDTLMIGMSNCPVCDFKTSGVWKGFGVDRQLKVEETLEAAPRSFSVQDAFKLLNAVHQTDEVWNTEFSFVYSHNEHKVYYCYDHQYDNIMEYQMEI